MPFVFSLCFSLACAPRTGPEPTTSAGRIGAATSPAADVRKVDVAGLSDLACDAGGCIAVVDGAARRLDSATLELGGDALAEAPGLLVPGPPWRVLVGCTSTACTYRELLEADPGEAHEPVVPQEPPDPAALARTWNRQIAKGWRSPFQERVPTPGGGSIAYLRGMDARGAQIVRSGGGLRVAAAPGVSTAAGYPPRLALHPTGREAYLVVWPDGTLLAFDPDSLVERWSLEVGAAAHGLFVDPDGRWLVAATGGAVPEDRLVDWPSAPPPLPEGWEPSGDLALRLRERPPSEGTALVDLASGQVAVAMAGTYLRWIALPDGARLLATTRGIARIGPVH